MMDRDDALDYAMLYSKAVVEIKRLQEHVITLQELRKLDLELITKLRAEIALMSK